MTNTKPPTLAQLDRAMSLVGASDEAAAEIAAEKRKAADERARLFWADTTPTQAEIDDADGADRDACSREAGPL
jgi:hypothetical protein